MTKCRYIIEKKIGFLKRLQSLDNIRNTVLGHIQIDYRIGCAMANFNHRPCETDGINSEKIANKMKKKAMISENLLSMFIQKQLAHSNNTRNFSCKNIS